MKSLEATANPKESIYSIAREKSAEYYGHGVDMTRSNYEVGFFDGYDYAKQEQENTRLRKALENIMEVTGTSTLQYHIAKEALK